MLGYLIVKINNFGFIYLVDMQNRLYAYVIVFITIETGTWQGLAYGKS